MMEQFILNNPRKLLATKPLKPWALSLPFQNKCVTSSGSLHANSYQGLL
jgi:hypothetical protein